MMFEVYREVFALDSIQLGSAQFGGGMSNWLALDWIEFCEGWMQSVCEMEEGRVWL